MIWRIGIATKCECLAWVRGIEHVSENLELFYTSHGYAILHHKTKHPFQPGKSHMKQNTNIQMLPPQGLSRQYTLKGPNLTPLQDPNGFDILRKIPRIPIRDTRQVIRLALNLLPAFVAVTLSV